MSSSTNQHQAQTWPCPEVSPVCHHRRADVGGVLSGEDALRAVQQQRDDGARHPGPAPLPPAAGVGAGLRHHVQLLARGEVPQCPLALQLPGALGQHPTAAVSPHRKPRSAPRSPRCWPASWTSRTRSRERRAGWPRSPTTIITITTTTTTPSITPTAPSVHNKRRQRREAPPPLLLPASLPAAPP